MNDTHFVNCTGLPAERHLTSAYDIALMSRELIWHHPDIRRFTTIWMDSLRGGESMLVNTNKLIRFYDGATGLKTGSTGSAGYCLSATAEKNGMELIAVVLKGKTSDERFSDAKSLLNYGFSTWSLVTVTVEPAELTGVSVRAPSTYYTGKPQHASTIAFGQSVDGTTVTFTYSDNVDGNYTSGGPTFTDAGTYTVYYKAEAANHEPATGTFTVTIDPLPICLLSVSSSSTTYAVVPSDLPSNT